MFGTTRPGRHRLTAAGIAALAVVGLSGCAASAGSSASVAHPTSSSSSSAPSSSASSSSRDSGAAGKVQNPATTTIATPPAAGAVPTNVSIPSIGVSSGLESLAIGTGGVLDPPASYADAGWYAAGVIPGAVGPAVIAGHIDSPGGTAIFGKLHDLVAGDKVVVTLSSGQVETFQVTGSQAALKSAFPTSDVYGSTPNPSLRLITCDGVFNTTVGHYNENLIVFADLVSTT